MMWLLYTLATIAAYIWLGKATIYIHDKATGDNLWDEFSPGAIFWPLTWVFLAGIAAFELISSPVKSLKAVESFFSNKKTIKESGKGGTPSPTDILVDLIRTHIVMDFDNVEETRWKDHNEDGSWYDVTWKKRIRDASVSVKVRRKRNSYGGDYWSSPEIHVSGQCITLNEPQQKIIHNTLKEAMSLVDQKKAAEKTKSQELSALEAVTKILGVTPELPAPEVHPLDNGVPLIVESDLLQPLKRKA